MTSARFRELAYPLMRVVIGLLLSCHGAQKIFGTFGGAPSAGDEALMTLAGVIELFGGLCIAIGLFTSSVAFLASGEMAVAYFMVHAPRGLWPIDNGGELAVVYCFVLLAIAARGGGEFSIDRARKRRGDRASAVFSSAAARARLALPQDN
jgi:putative oxidoreductase